MTSTSRPLFVLASSSPRRRELLATMGLVFEVVPPDVDEIYIPGETPQDHVARLSRTKALEVGIKERDCWILGADTIVVVDETILGKPKDEDEAYAMLKLLSGREHRVITGFFLYNRVLGAGKGEVIESTVKVKELCSDEIEWYVRTGEPFDKAGAYAIQGIGMFMIESIRGSHTNVIGLPVCEVVQALHQVGAIRLFL